MVGMGMGMETVEGMEEEVAMVAAMEVAMEVATVAELSTCDVPTFSCGVS